MIFTQTQNQSTNFAPVVVEIQERIFDTPIKTDTLVSPEYFKLLSAQLEEKIKPFDFIIEFNNLNCDFNFQIADIDWSLNSNEVSLYLNLNNQLVIKASLVGYWENNKEQNFKLEKFNFKLERKLETPLSEFLTSTLWAILGLSSKFKIRIPELNYDFSASFELPINEIRKLLQERQIAYRLLIIENTFGISLPFPQGFIDGEDIESIAFCYHSIIDREFDWFSFPTIIPYEANQETLSWFPKTNEPIPITFRPDFITKSIFGIELGIGIQNAKIESAVIDNYDEAKENLLRLDGSIFNVKLRSLNGRSRFFSLEVPEFEPQFWSSELHKLVNLDKNLDAMLLERYFNLATSTLDGLTDKQKKEITKRPKLNRMPRISE